MKAYSKDPGEGKAVGLARQEIRVGAKQFQTTRWSVVLVSSQSRAPGYKEAFADLCKIYWYPLYGFIRHRGYSPEDAEDLVQGFFLYLVERKTLSRADRSKGKFRSFLLASLQNFLSDEAKRARCLKRGGKAGLMCINLEEAADRYGFEPIEELTPEKIFDARWAMTLIGEALNRLNREYVAQGKGTTFQALRGFLDPIHTKSLPSYEEAAAQLEVSVGALKALIHRLRKQYTALMREEISRTVSDAADVNSEIHQLCEALLAAEGWLMPLTEALNPVSGAGGGSADEEAGSILRRFENYEVMLDADGRPIELGHGAMGVTYKAFDVDLRCPVTLKVISERYLGDESARLRFLREARAAASVRHPNVASVFHLGRSGSSYFYAMEFVEGETLEQLIRRSGQVKVKVALEIITQAAAGLAAIHEQNLVHRDIKPSNILVRLKDDGNITAKIIDLGLAKALNEPSAQTAISTPGAFAGTPEFASPEQFAGIGADIRSDLYSLGVTLWEMLTGKVPFRGTPGEVMYQHQHSPLPLEELEGLPQPLVVLLETLLEKDPGQRFQDPGELLKAIPTISGRIEAGRRITREGLRKMPPVAPRTGTRRQPARQGPKRISVARLPVTGSDLFGREEDIAFLDDAWANKDANVVTIVAWAGVGKSTLVNHWLRRTAAEQYRSAQLVFGWSFYRQGTSGGTSSADEFIDAALAWFGDPDPRVGTAWEKGERLAKLVAHR